MALICTNTEYYRVATNILLIKVVKGKLEKKSTFPSSSSFTHHMNRK